jgi:hypothetical protein
LDRDCCQEARDIGACLRDQEMVSIDKLFLPLCGPQTLVFSECPSCDKPEDTVMRRVFFSFHYEEDCWRAAQVRNVWVTKGKANSFLDAASWEKIRRSGKQRVRKWIEEQLHGTSVTVVLIGEHTSEREYVLYEIQRSHELHKGLLGIYIHQVKDQDENWSIFAGSNPFRKFRLESRNFWEELFPRTFSSLYPTYDWVDDKGYNNLSSWIEAAAKRSGR